MVVSAFAPGVYGRIDGATRRAGAVTQRNITALKSTYWLLLVSGFFEPLLYLASIGFGVGKLIGPVDLGDGTTVTYQAFVAPAMLAASAMTGALTEASVNFFAKMKHSKTFDAILSTPVRPTEIAFGELMWAMARGAMYSATFVVIMTLMGLTTPARAPFALLAALLVGFSFGGVGMAFATFMRGWQDFDIFATVQVGLFLFSATFVPLHRLQSAWLRGLVQLSPLYQSVALICAITLGRLDAGLLIHVGYLVAMAAVGLFVASRRMNTYLLK